VQKQKNAPRKVTGAITVPSFAVNVWEVNHAIKFPENVLLVNANQAGLIKTPVSTNATSQSVSVNSVAIMKVNALLQTIVNVPEAEPWARLLDEPELTPTRKVPKSKVFNASV